MTTQHVPLNLVHWAADLIDRSGVVGKLAAWEKEDASYRGGRPTSLSTRAVLISWLVVAYERQPLFILRVAELLSVRLTPEAAAVMCVPATFAEVPYMDMVRRVDRAMDRILDRLDYKPLPTYGRRLTKAEWEATERDRAERADELENKRLRMFRFANDLLHAQYDSLPGAARTQSVSVAIDATFLDAPSRGMSQTRLDNRKATETVPMDPDAGWYVRTYEQRAGWDGTVDNALRKVGYGYEAEVAVLVSNDPYRPQTVPHIIVGYNFHSPNQSPGQNARLILEDIVGWGHRLGYVITDQAYLPGANPDDLQHFLREQKALPSMRYPVPTSRSARGEGTIQAEAHGAHMLEGRWQCPATPLTARQVMVDYNKAVAADEANTALSKPERAAREKEHRALRYARLEQRAKWELRVKERRDDTVIMTCPAVGKDRTLECPLKPNQPPVREGVVPLPVLQPPRAPGRICTNQSSTSFDRAIGAKYQQHLRYGSPEWEDLHIPSRQVVESFNWRLKHADNSLHDNTNRMMRGEASQSFLTILGIVAANAYAIFDWEAEHFDPTVPAGEPRTRLSRTDRHKPVTRTRGRGLPAGRAARLGLTSR